MSLSALAWQAVEAPAALSLLSRRLGLLPPREMAGGEAALWDGALIESLQQSTALDLEEVLVQHGEAEHFLSRASLALLPLPDFPDRALLLVGQRRGQVRLLTPEGQEVRLPRGALLEALRSPREQESHERSLRWVASARIAPSRQRRAAEALLGHELEGQTSFRAWLLSPGEASTWQQQAREVRGPARVTAILLTHLLAYLLWLPLWGLLSWMAFGDHMQGGWWAAWVLLLVSIFVLRLQVLLSSQLLATDVLSHVRQRLLRLSMQLSPDRLRGFGIGHLLGVALEVSEVSSFLQSGALVALTSLLEVLGLALFLALVVGPWPALALLSALLLLLLLASRHFQAVRRWTAERMRMTQQDVERILGHRTRIAQEDPACWHQEEEQALDAYLHASERLDRRYVLLRDLLPRAWFLLMLLFLLATWTGQGNIGVAGAGGVLATLMGWRSLRNLASALAEGSQAAAGWERVRDFLRFRERPEARGDARLQGLSAPGAGSQPLLEARDLHFQYPGRPQEVLSGARLEVQVGDRIRLEGESGGGKSTLATLLAQLREPTSGLVLLDGIDVQTLGSRRWRQRVVLVPQFQDNHVFTGPFAFNVLMGRQWPPSRADLQEAEHICRGLGLGPLLDRMPGGMLQLVGETGWQMSHGERSRLFIARALAQRPDVLILDESLGALDPQSLHQAAHYLQTHQGALLVIAHP